MTVADITVEYPEPPALHTEETFRQTWTPDPSKGGVDEHWHFFVTTLNLALRQFGFPAAIYDKWLLKKPERREAFNMLRLLEAMLRRILLMLAAADQRPLEPATPRKVSTPSLAPAPAGKERQIFRGMPPEKLRVQFTLVPLVSAPRKQEKKPPKPLTNLERFFAERHAERMKDRAWRDFFKNAAEKRHGSAFVLAARFEAVIRVYANPEPFVMRLRQKLAAEQGRQAKAVCVRMLMPGPRLKGRLVVMLDDLFDDACGAVARLSGRSPPIVSG